MNAVQDPDLDDTDPTLKIVQMPDERLTPPGGRSIERSQATGRVLWNRRAALVRPYQQQASTVARPVPRTDPEQANVTPKPWPQTNDFGIPDLPTQRLQAAAKPPIKVTPDIPTPRLQVVVESTIEVVPDIPDIPTRRLQAVVEPAIKSKEKKNQKKNFLEYSL